MGVNTPDNNKTGTATADGVFRENFENASGAQQSNNANNANTGGFSSRGRSSRPGLTQRLSAARGAMTRRRPAADREKLLKAYEESFQVFQRSGRLPGGENLKLMLVDRQALGKRIDLLVAYLPLQHEGESHVAIFTNIIADEADTLDPVKWTGSSQRTYTYAVTPGDAWTQDVYNRVQSLVQEQLGTRGVVHNAGVQVLPVSMDITDPNQVHATAFFASEGLTRTVLDKIMKDTRDVISVADIGENEVVEARLTYSTLNSTGPGGLPIRTDIQSKLSFSQRNSETDQRDKAFDLDQSQPLAGAAGYIDLGWEEPGQHQQTGYQQQQVTQRYRGRFVLTRLDTDTDSITPELQLLCLAGATLPTRQMAWARIWSQEFRGHDGHDIGAIGYELSHAAGGEVEKIKTDTNAFNNEELFKLVSFAIWPDVIIQYDIEETGPLSFQDRVLLRAAEGDADAENALLVAADNLSNGHFSKRWDNRERFVLNDSNRIHNGYYDTPAGERRDIRDLDYLMVLERFGSSDPEMVVRWQATFDDLSRDEPERVAEREDFIKKILGPTVVITGYSRRVNFHPEGLNTLLASLRDAGLEIRQDANSYGFTGQAARGRGNLGSMAFSASGSGGVFSNGSAGRGGRSFGNTFTGGSTWRGR